jgi:hypothetical protein
MEVDGGNDRVGVALEEVAHGTVLGLREDGWPAKRVAGRVRGRAGRAPCGGRAVVAVQINAERPIAVVASIFAPVTSSTVDKCPQVAIDIEHWDDVCTAEIFEQQSCDSAHYGEYAEILTDRHALQDVDDLGVTRFVSLHKLADAVHRGHRAKPFIRVC